MNVFRVSSKLIVSLVSMPDTNNVMYFLERFLYRIQQKGETKPIIREKSC